MFHVTSCKNPHCLHCFHKSKPNGELLVCYWWRLPVSLKLQNKLSPCTQPMLNFCAIVENKKIYAAKLPLCQQNIECLTSFFQLPQRGGSNCSLGNVQLFKYAWRHASHCCIASEQSNVKFKPTCYFHSTLLDFNFFLPVWKSQQEQNAVTFPWVFKCFWLKSFAD